MQIQLKVIEGPAAGAWFVLEEFETALIGRHKDCEVRIEGDKVISRRHCQLEWEEPLLLLRDLGSHNGTLVNGVRYGGREKGTAPSGDLTRSGPTVALQDGDRIRFGKTTLRLQIGAGEASRESARTEVKPIPAAVGPEEEELLQMIRQGLLDHKIEGHLGTGAFGTVYRARREDGSEVAIKILLSKVAANQSARLRFFREIDALPDPKV